MLTRAYSAGILGVEGRVVTVEADVGLGLPGMTLVGQATGALVEARERVKSALGHCGHEIRPRKQIVNLAPADMRKNTPGLDLAVAMALLGCHRVVPAAALERLMLWGELALDGKLRPASGTLVVADCARQAGFGAIAVPAESAREAALIPGIDVLPVAALPDLIAHLRGESGLEPYQRSPDDLGGAAHDAGTPDLADIRGLAMGRLAIEVMVAGGHNLLLHGPPGVGKTMLARRAAGLFPALDREAALEVTKIHSVAHRRVADGLVDRPPIRAPHHTVTAAGLLGGGNPPRPGEVSLAHRGLLFLDELPEFPRACLEGLREPLEDGEVALVRACYAVRFPSRFQLMAAMNPCPCGHLGNPERACVCSVQAVERYRQRLSGPLLDRIDVLVPIAPASSDELGDPQPGESSVSVRDRIVLARGRQLERLTSTPWRTNAEIPATHGVIDQLVRLTPAASKLLAGVARKRRLSPRAQHRVRRVALTLSDLQARDTVDAAIEAEPIAQALHLRHLPAAADR